MSESDLTPWNPAWMPNAVAHMVPAESISEPKQIDVKPSISDLESSSLRAESGKEHEDIQQDASETGEEGGESMGDNTDHPELPDLRNALESSLRSPGGLEMNERPSHSNVEEATVGDGEHKPNASTNESKHVSTSSFARTVSHDVNWGEDDDVDSEWNLSRTNTDPFKMMPKNDRTNSFPVVPAAREHIPQYDHPGSHSQVEDIMNEVEQSPHDIFSDDEQTPDGGFFAEQTSTDAFDAFRDDPQDPENGHQASVDYGQLYGGDVDQEEDEESRARYEEGVPLFQSTEEAQPPNNSLFSDEEHVDEEADFFTQHRTPHGEGLEPGKPGLERKSTMQVINSLQFQPNHTPDFPIQEEVESQESAGENGNTAKNTIDELFEGSDSEFPIGAGTGEVDLSEQWKAVLAAEDELLDDDDELLPDSDDENKAADPAAFFGSDDEGFLDDNTNLNEGYHPNGTLGQNGYPAGTTSNVARPSSNRYLPAGVAAAVAAPPQPLNSYAPAAPLLTDFSRPASSSANGSPYIATHPIGNYPVQQQSQQRPDLPKAQSFADKSKGGYASPYDLPMEVVKPRKRMSTNQMNRGYSAPVNVAPPRASSMQSSFAPTSQSFTNAPTNAQQHQQPMPPTVTPPVGSVAKQKPGGGGGFFEDLPILSRPKAATRHTATAPVQSQSMYAPPMNGSRMGVGHQNYAPPPGQQHAPVVHQQVSMHQGPSLEPSMLSPPMVQGLVSPERVNPYASIPAVGQPVVPATTSRYSPAPPPLSHSQSVPGLVSQARYSPAPPQSRPQYAPPLANLQSPPQPILPHLPRTSSPLAHFERSQDRLTGSTGEVPTYDRRSSSGYEQSLRTHPLPPTREVDETDANYVPQTPINAEQETFASPQQAMGSISQTPPPPTSIAGRIGRSPLKRNSSSNYMPQFPTNLGPAAQTFVPPPRSHTQSPSTAFGGPRLEMSTAEPYQRPASIEASSPRNAESFGHMPTFTAPGRPRAPSNVNYVAPTDGREHDPLQRWKGCPVFTWGVGGTMVTSFPKDIPRYGINSTTPMVVRTPGEVRVQNVRDVTPLEARLISFPGPLKGKTKKKEVVAWLASGIQILEQNASYLRNMTLLSHNDKRTEERLLLWKTLQVFIENDGILEGNPIVEKAVRAVLSPGIDNDLAQDSPLYATGADLSGISQSNAIATKSDPVDPAAVDQMRRHLLRGEREKAVWEAVDKRLWAHAMLISNTVSKDLYKQVCQEFVQKEVKNVGDNTEPLAALYEIFAGNFEESIDELVPPSARAGFQMVSTSTSISPSKDALQGLDRWRETLGLVLSNRSTDDSQALTALGKLLSGYGRAEAAHICFLFARTSSVFGGIDDPLSNMVLVGSDHLRQPFDFDRELEPVLLSEVYEYGLSLASTTNITSSSPHLAIYKLHHAMVLAEYGHREKALQYCESIATSITSQTRRSPYHHAHFVSCLDDLSKRLKQSPKDENGSWISKPSIDKVSGSVWATFNKFVAGDEQENADSASIAGSESGPFARIAGGTPTISRSPSVADIYGSYNGGLGINGISSTAQPAKPSSRYAPGGSYAPSPYDPPSSSHGSQPRTSLEGRSSGEYRRGPYEPRRQTSQSSEYRPSSQQQYQPSNLTPQSAGYSPFGSVESPYTPHATSSAQDIPSNGYQPLQSLNSFDGPQSFQSSTGGYEPPSSNGYDPPTTSSYEPSSSGGYEPPSYEPISTEESDSPVDTKPKKKSFMDDDDDIPVPKAAASTGEKTKAEKDREADEAFRKAAEADAKLDKPAPQQKKGWGLTGWFGGKKEAAPADSASSAPKAIRAKLGEESSFVYDPDLKRWVNKKAGADNTPARGATPPPPRATGPPRTASGPPSLHPAGLNMPRSVSAMSAPPTQMKRVGSMGSVGAGEGDGGLTGLGLIAPPPLMSRTQSNGSMNSAGQPSRPNTSMSNASSIDDLLGPPSLGGGSMRKGGKGTLGKGKKKGRGYIDVMGDKAAGGGA